MVIHNQPTNPPPHQKTPLAHELVGHLAYPNLTLNMVPHFRDETYGTPGYYVQGRIIWGINVQGHNVQGRIVPVPFQVPG